MDDINKRQGADADWNNIVERRIPWETSLALVLFLQGITVITRSTTLSAWLRWKRERGAR